MAGQLPVGPSMNLSVRILLPIILHLLNFLIGVEETWLDNELRQLPLFLRMASGSRSLKPDTDNVHASLEPSPPGNTVNLRLLRTTEPRLLKQVEIRHILPRHPSAEDVPVTLSGKQYVVIIKGPLKGSARLLNKIEGDQVWVKNPDDGVLTEHAKYELVLSRDIKSKGKGKGKGKGKKM